MPSKRFIRELKRIRNNDCKSFWIMHAFLLDLFQRGRGILQFGFSVVEELQCGWKVQTEPQVDDGPRPGDREQSDRYRLVDVLGLEKVVFVSDFLVPYVNGIRDGSQAIAEPIDDAVCFEAVFLAERRDRS